MTSPVPSPAWRPALVLLLALTVLTGGVYPLLVTGVAQLLWPAQADGSLVIHDGRVAGSSLLGQAFAGPQWFHGRPSATSGFPYDAALSGGSNAGPLNPGYIGTLGRRASAAHADANGKIPVDLLTASGSGLDPDLSPAAARWQVARVARFRSLDPRRVDSLVTGVITPRQFGVLGEPRVNVLALNLALLRLVGSP